MYLRTQHQPQGPHANIRAVGDGWWEVFSNFSHIKVNAATRFKE
jgi:hypothetical protein